jgi:(2S)-methylsuccinyl-CoA dehydrogenase
MVQDTFRRFADEADRPVAEHVHRHNADIPEDIISGLAEMGAFGLSIPEEYGGFASGGEASTSAWSWPPRSCPRLARHRRLAHHPARDPRPGPREAGGTEEQKHEWLPKLATAEVMNAVAVTEPDYGSDVAGIKVTATEPTDGDGWVINGVKTWCTFGARADVLMLLARTDPDRSKATAACRCSSWRRSAATATASSSPSPAAGRWRAGPSTPSATAACTPTRSPSRTGGCPPRTSSAATTASAKGFYYQMAGFENGRLQTAARAVGVMQAAYEEAATTPQPRGVRLSPSPSTSSPR